MIGIVGYGAYIPRYRIKTEEIARTWKRDYAEIKDSLLVEEKAVAGEDEDAITMAVEAGKNALARSQVDAKDVGALFIGSESHPYVVKPSGTVAAEALGLPRALMLADLEFACKAGTAAMQICYSMVKAGEIKYGIAIGSDTAQGRPGDALEYTAASGAAAFVIGKNPLAIIDGFYSYTSDTSDFWRREGKKYPSHGSRFTGEPAYFKHVLAATRGLMEKLALKKEDFNYVVFHMPNAKFPIRAAKMLGFEKEQYLPGLVVTKIGNTYSGSSLLGLTAVLDMAEPGDKILLTSYGSGAGSDSFAITLSDNILTRRDLAKKTGWYVNRKEYIDYGTYARMRGKLSV
ncbi:MAG: hydroxymethylglutaryl-CoA synthase [Candidatus Aenigmarchaeota archaeon]|nr:hydroxymethylglutaryl-CoA synthase [Candidatus Aenigmarchaeota archaeon]